MGLFSFFQTNRNRRGTAFIFIFIVLTELIVFVTYTADESFNDNVTVSNRELTQQEQFKPQNSGSQSGVVRSLFANRLDGFKNAWDRKYRMDTAVFLHIPKSGGSSFKDIFGDCLRLTVASEVGIQEGHDQDTEIGVFHLGEKKSKFVNVDPTTLPGLERTNHMGLIQSGLADVMVTRHLYEVNSLFDDHHKGRLFTIFRHPVDRITSLFSYLQVASWDEAYKPIFADMELEEYAETIHMDENWLVRFLTDSEMVDVLTEKHLNTAKALLREKFIVGLLSKKKESMARFEQFFQWNYKYSPKDQEKCRRSYLRSGSNINLKTYSDITEPGSRAYELISRRNRWDILLYEFIENLFIEQGIELGDAETFRWQNSECCMCDEPPTCDMALDWSDLTGLD